MCLTQMVIGDCFVMKEMLSAYQQLEDSGAASVCKSSSIVCEKVVSIWTTEDSCNGMKACSDVVEKIGILV